MGTEAHGFEIGQTYRDRRGAYQVLRVDAARGTIDTEDEFGTTRTGEDAALKWRIWCNLPVVPARVEARRPAPPPPVAPPETIETICVQRGIPSVVHFTPARNVPSILRHGLVPRAEHEALGSLDVEYADSLRPDRHGDATSVSLRAELEFGETWSAYLRYGSVTLGYEAIEGIDDPLNSFTTLESSATLALRVAF